MPGRLGAPGAPGAGRVQTSGFKLSTLLVLLDTELSPYARTRVCIRGAELRQHQLRESRPMPLNAPHVLDS